MARRSSQEILNSLEAIPDGLPTRDDVGVWTLQKLAILLLYFPAFTKACQTAGGGYYADGFSGPGICHVKDAIYRPEYVWGSPLLALRTLPAFVKCCLLDLSSESVTALRARTNGERHRVLIHQGDANRDLVPMISQQVPRYSPCFCLLDPEGMDLAWATVESIAAIPRTGNKPELLILFPSEWLTRLLPRAGVPDAHNEVVLDRIMPGGGWRDIYSKRLERKITPREAKRGYSELYRSALEQLGYEAFNCTVRGPFRAGAAYRDQYELIFATQSGAGERIMRDVFSRTYRLDLPISSQAPLFE